MIPAEVKRACWTLCLIGVAMATAGGTLKISIGVASIPSGEAWELGLAPVFVAFGVALAGLAYALYRRQRWARWPIALWFPVYFLVFALVAAMRGFLLMDGEWLEALIVGCIWLYGTWWIFRGEAMKAHLG